MNEQEFLNFSVFDLLSQFGGFFGSFIIVGSMLGRYINEKLMKAKMVESLYNIDSKEVRKKKIKIKVNKSNAHISEDSLFFKEKEDDENL